MERDDWVMGALAVQDQYRPLGNDPWTNTMRGTRPAPGQGFPEVPQSPVLFNTKAGPITEADIGTGIDVAMGVSGGGLATKVRGAKGPAMGETLSPKAPFPQYAEAYPPVGPPSLVVDEKKLPQLIKSGMTPEAARREAEYLEKTLTPEAEAFQKARNKIQKQLDKEGYTPYFDPAKRFDVDPANYGPFADTAVAAAPKTAKTQQQWAERYGTPEARERLQAGYKAGQGIADADRWYWMGQLEKAYVDELGEVAGREAFKKEFADMMAATTGGASPYNNFMMAHYASHMAKTGQALPERSYDLPFPIGGRYAAGNIAQARKYIEGGMQGFDPAVNPKRYDFSSAYTGNPRAGTMDEQMFGAIQPGGTIPEWYGPATQVLREEAAKAGVAARDFQDVGWAGLKKIKTEGKGKGFEYEGPMINHINRSIETTHRLTGMPREEIVRRGLIRKEIPMYGIGAAAAVPVMGSLAAQDRYQ